MADDLFDALERQVHINSHTHEVDHERAALALLITFRNRRDADFDELVRHVATEFDPMTMTMAQTFLAEMLLNLLMIAHEMGGIDMTEAQVTALLYRHLTQPQGDHA